MHAGADIHGNGINFSRVSIVHDEIIPDCSPNEATMAYVEGPSRFGVSSHAHIDLWDKYYQIESTCVTGGQAYLHRIQKELLTSIFSPHVSAE